MASQTDYYEILQVHPAAHQDVIQAAYRRLALLYHPDRNPTPEATATMARLNEAYAILSAPEKRATYDRSRGTQTQTGSGSNRGAQTNPGSSNNRNTQTNSGTSTSGRGASQSHQRESRRSAYGRGGAGYFTMGSNKAEVSQVQGHPLRTETNHLQNKETWHYGHNSYGRSSVEFDLSTGLVRRWSDTLGLLKVRMLPGPNVTNASFCSLGSHKDDVLRLQGTPVRFSTNHAQAKETWYFVYGTSKIEFHLYTGRIQGWDNIGGRLNVRVVQGSNTTNAGFISHGSHKDDVIRLKGQPISVTTSVKVPRYAPPYSEQWMYVGDSTGTVQFINDRVVGGSLLRANSAEPPPRPEESASQPEEPSPQPQSEPASEQSEHPASSDAAAVSAAIEVGHLKSEVYGLLGAPTKIEQTNTAEVWYYGENWFAFSLDAQAVIEHGDASSPPLAEEPKTAPSPWEWLTGDNPPIEKPEPAQNDDPPLSETLTGEEQSQSEFTEPSEPAQEVQAPSEETSQINGYSKWRAPESPAKLGKTAAMGEGKGCLLPVSLISAAVVAAPAIWFLI